jgi:hypothetical protein
MTALPISPIPDQTLTPDEGFQSIAEIASHAKLPPSAGGQSAATPTIAITKRNLKRLEAICLIR